MTIYEKELARQLDHQYKKLSSQQLLRKLMEIGVVDYSRCKVLVVREYVDNLLRTDIKKTDAMWKASEKFACSYEYVRKCMYYYQDINYN